VSPATASAVEEVPPLTDFLSVSSAPEETPGDVLAEAGEPLAGAAVNAG
jgi:hypothetical protein